MTNKEFLLSKGGNHLINVVKEAYATELSFEQWLDRECQYELKDCICKAYRTKEIQKYFYDPFTGERDYYALVTKGICNATREQDECKCDGDINNCTFYKRGLD